MGKNDRFIAIFIGLGIWTLVIFSQWTAVNNLQQIND